MIDFVSYPGVKLPKDITREEEWLLLENVAKFLKMKAIHQVNIPIPINLIFIGFEGDGNNGINLDEEHFREWFEHIEHSLRHTIVPVGEEQTTTDYRPTNATRVSYDLDIKLIKLCPLVNTVLEDSIYWHVRPEDPDVDRNILPKKKSDQQLFYVDAFKISRILHHLVKTLKLTNAYTIFVLNPKKAVGDNRQYGYRTGFSDLEIQRLLQSEDFMGFEPTEVCSPRPDIIPSIDEKEDKKEDENFDHGDEKYNIKYYSYVEESEQWARWYIKNMLNGGVGLTSLCTDDADPDDPNCVWLSQRPEEQDIVKLAKYIMENGSDTEREYIKKIKYGTMVQQECLVDAWIGHERVAFIDLAAGPFKWGPIVSGEGVRSTTTVPTVPEFEAIQVEKEKLKQQKMERDEGRDDDSFKRSPQDLVSTKQKIDKEVQLLQAYVDASCEDESTSTHHASVVSTHDFARCNYAKQALSKAKKKHKQMLDKIEEGEGVGRNLKYEHDLVGDVEEGRGASLLTDNFLSGLGAMLSRTFRHLVVPPTPLFQTYPTERVSFHFFHISNHKNIKPRDLFPYNDFKKELLRFRMPGQEFSFVLKTIDLGTDRELTMALAHSLRTAVLPSLDVFGKFSAPTVRYIDSLDLEMQLNNLAVDENEHREEGEVIEEEDELSEEEAKAIRSGKGQASRHIPVFFFSLDEDVPLFIDKYYQAKALEDMVIIVQSNSEHWQSRLYCNSKPIYWNLTDPLRVGLSAIALRYAGLVPNHITYDEANECAAQSWLWSVGDSPLVHTSSGSHFSQTQIDIAQRNLIVNAIIDVIATTNEAVRLLQNIQTSTDNFDVLALLPLKKLHRTQVDITTYIKRIVSRLEILDFNKATVLVASLLRKSAEAQHYLEDAIEMLEVTVCVEYEDIGATVPQNIPSSSSSKGGFFSSSWVMACIVFDILLVAVYFIFGTSSRKKVKQW